MRVSMTTTTDELNDRKNIRNYFNGENDQLKDKLKKELDELGNTQTKLYFFSAALGFIALISITTSFGLFLLFSIGAAIVAYIGYGYSKTKPYAKPTDDREVEKTIDRIVPKDLKKLIDEAEKVAGITEGIAVVNSFVLPGFPEGELVKDIMAIGRYGSDNILRYTPRAATVLFFTEDQIVSYEGAIDTTTGNIVYDRVREFFYQDITSVTRFTDTSEVDVSSWSRDLKNSLKDISVNDVVQFTQKDVFQISLADGNFVRVALKDTKFAGERKERFKDETSVESEQMIRTIRKLVRDKKYQALHPDNLVPNVSEPRPGLAL